jgi:hypothetical protein
MLTFRCPLPSQSEKLIAHYSATIERLIGSGWQAQKAGARGAAPASVASEGGTPICRVHGGAMKPSRKPGSFFCTRKLADGTYCSEKVEG